MSEFPISYTARSDTAPETETSALVNAYRLILDSAMKKGRLLDKGGPEDARERINDDRTHPDCT
jgi:hypothetical protein